MTKEKRIVQSLKSLTNELKHSQGYRTIFEDCPECGTQLAFEVLDISKRQSKYVRCKKCGETIRLVYERGEEAADG